MVVTVDFLTLASLSQCSVVFVKMNPEEPSQVEEQGADVGGCFSLGCVFVFLVAGLAWPLLHILGRSYEPESLFVPIFVGGPAFAVAHILASISMAKQPRGKSLGAWALMALWIAIALALAVMLVVAFVDDRNRPHGDSSAENAAEFGWYGPWIRNDIEAGAAFHSEFALAAGEVRTIVLASESAVTIGLVVKDGYEITKTAGSIYMGTDKEPHRASGSPGFSAAFSPDDGVIRLRIENTTVLDTRIALHTKPAG